MTHEELLAVAEIVEKLTNRYRDQEAAHKTALAELRASFNARTSSYERRLENLREEIIHLNDANGRFMVERDGLLTQVQDMRSEMERLRGESVKYKAERDELYQREGIEQKRRLDVEDERDALRAEVAELKTQLKSPTTKQHPVKVGEWVEPCDPPNHDTEAGKAAAEAALKSESVTDIKVGDLCEVFQATTRTLKTDIGITGRVSSVHLDPCHGGFLVKFDPSTQSRRSTGMQAFGLCDVRKVTT